MHRRILSLAAFFLVLAFGVHSTVAQEEKKPANQGSAKNEDPAPTGKPGLPGGTVGPLHPYRVDFTITELEDGKKINSRRYSMLLSAGSWNEIKIGTRVPVSPTTGSFQYIDLGTSINCRLIESGDDLAIDVHSDFSNISGPDGQHSSQPVIRQIRLEGNTLVSSGKPAVIGIVDDPNSDRQFQLEATVTKLR
jgi:hypothetical protein